MSVNWASWLKLATILPAIANDVVLGSGAYGDRYGRKNNILLGLTGNIVDFYRFILLCAFISFPFWVAILISIINGFTGYIQIVFTSGSAYLADTTVDPDLLTIKLTAFGAWGQISWALVNFITVFLLEWMSLFLLQVIGMSFSVIAFFYTLWRIKHVPPLQMKAYMRIKQNFEEPIKINEKENDEETDKLEDYNNEESDISVKLAEETWMDFLKQTALSLGTTIQTYTKPRHGSKRLKLCLCLGIMHAVGNLSAIPLKKYLKLRDTTLLIIANACLTAGQVLFGLATETWIVYLSLVVGSLGLMLTPALQSYSAQQVSPDEVGKVYATYGIMNNVTILFAQIFYPYIYTATADFFPGLVYEINAAMTALCFIPIFIIHCLEIKTRQS